MRAEDEFILKVVAGLDADSDVLATGEDILIAFDAGDREDSINSGEPGFSQGFPVRVYANRTAVGDFVASSRISKRKTNKLGSTEGEELISRWVFKSRVNHCDSWWIIFKS